MYSSCDIAQGQCGNAVCNVYNIRMIAYVYCQIPVGYVVRVCSHIYGCVFAVCMFVNCNCQFPVNGWIYVEFNVCEVFGSVVCITVVCYVCVMFTTSKA